MRHIGRYASFLLSASLLGSAVWWSVACAGEQTRTSRPARAAPEVVLEAELHHPGLVVLRSPTFR
jgi:hypothetical protein